MCKFFICGESHKCLIEVFSFDKRVVERIFKIHPVDHPRYTHEGQPHESTRLEYGPRRPYTDLDSGYPTPSTTQVLLTGPQTQKSLFGPLTQVFSLGL